ncbi:unnamed protein product [Adineta steineri]|uniref:Uncharacterized protein n=3 Tax=Adineta steineri TaxID=433720 RepID=A0A818ISA6_9BILA|nr:unnamed protein product [Adineta steineri]CAF3527706.1 unnamed protein product [Adineta steineri]
MVARITTHRKKNKQMYFDSTSTSVIASVCTAALPARSTIRSLGHSNTSIFQNYQLVWLDAHIDEHNDSNCQNTITVLRRIINYVTTFNEVDECMNYIGKMKDEKIILIISGTLGQNFIPIIHDTSQIISIFIFCKNKLVHELWAYSWSKIKGVFEEIPILYEAIKQAAEECDRNTISMSFININNETSVENLDKSFIYMQILKEIILEIDFKDQDIKDFTTYYRKHIVGNVAEQAIIDKLEREYHRYEPIWWCTNEYFLYSMLSRALRTMQIETIIGISFFIRDLHKYIDQVHSEEIHNSSSLIVYHGQGISQKNFDQLKKTQDGLLSFHNFLFTSKNRESPLNFARQTIINSDLIGILFVMTIDHSLTSTPFVNIRNDLTKGEVLLSIHSIFHIGQIQQIGTNNNRLWQVELTLANKNDLKLHVLNKRILDETISFRKGWCRLSELLIKQNQFNKAQQVCDIAMTRTDDENEKAFFYYQLGLIKFHQEEYKEASLFYNSSLRIHEKNLNSSSIDAAACYMGIGSIHEKMEIYWKALSFFEIAFGICEKILPTTDSLVTNCINNIGRICYLMKRYSKSIFYYKKVLKIYQNTSTSNQSDVAIAYKNIGLVYVKRNEYSNAITFFEKTLAIYKKILPSNHLDIAETYQTIGSVYDYLCEYSSALVYYEKALKIYEETLSSTHPNLALSHKSIGLIYFQRSDYLNALSYYEKAHDIYEQILPSNHPDLAASYVRHGSVYENTNNFTKALSYYKKAFEIYQNNYPINYHDLANVYNKISSVYFQMGKYSLALSFYECALDIEQELSNGNQSSIEQWDDNLDIIQDDCE